MFIYKITYHISYAIAQLFFSGVSNSLSYLGMRLLPVRLGFPIHLVRLPGLCLDGWAWQYRRQPPLQDQWLVCPYAVVETLNTDTF
jgi:hypothetical protein